MCPIIVSLVIASILLFVLIIGKKAGETVVKEIHRDGYFIVVLKGRDYYKIEIYESGETTPKFESFNETQGLVEECANVWVDTQLRRRR